MRDADDVPVERVANVPERREVEQAKPHAAPQELLPPCEPSRAAAEPSIPSTIVNTKLK